METTFIFKRILSSVKRRKTNLTGEKLTLENKYRKKNTNEL